MMTQSRIESVSLDSRLLSISASMEELTALEKKKAEEKARQNDNEERKLQLEREKFELEKLKFKLQAASAVRSGVELGDMPTQTLYHEPF